MTQNIDQILKMPSPQFSNLLYIPVVGEIKVEKMAFDASKIFTALDSISQDDRSTKCSILEKKIEIIESGSKLFHGQIVRTIFTVAIVIACVALGVFSSTVGGVIFALLICKLGFGFWGRHKMAVSLVAMKNELQQLVPPLVGNAFWHFQNP